MLAEHPHICTLKWRRSPRPSTITRGTEIVTSVLHPGISLHRRLVVIPSSPPWQPGVPAGRTWMRRTLVRPLVHQPWRGSGSEPSPSVPLFAFSSSKLPPISVPSESSPAWPVSERHLLQVVPDRGLCPSSSSAVPPEANASFLGPLPGGGPPVAAVSLSVFVAMVMLLLLLLLWRGGRGASWGEGGRGGRTGAGRGRGGRWTSWGGRRRRGTLAVVMLVMVLPVGGGRRALLLILRWHWRPPRRPLRTPWRGSLRALRLRVPGRPGL